MDHHRNRRDDNHRGHEVMGGRHHAKDLCDDHEGDDPAEVPKREDAADHNDEDFLAGHIPSPPAALPGFI